MSYNFTVNSSGTSEPGTASKNYAASVLKRYTDTPLSFLFFSEENIKNIQNVIKMLVFKETQQVIDNQDLNNLLVVMRSTYIEYHQHPDVIPETATALEKVELLKAYTTEVSRLNEIVINDITPRILSGLVGYLGYLKDSSRVPIPNERSKNVNSTGTREYRSITATLGAPL